MKYVFSLSVILSIFLLFPRPLSAQPSVQNGLNPARAPVGTARSGNEGNSPAGHAIIEWRLVNPFRLFLDPQDTRAQLELYRSLSQKEMQTPVLSMERRLAGKDGLGWARNVAARTCWDQKRNRYRFCRGKGDGYIEPRKHEVLLRFAGNYEPTDRCEWILRDTGTKAKGRGRRNKSAKRLVSLCGDEVKMDIPFPRGARIEIIVNGQKRGEENIRVRDLFIVGIGDSFASGEGNPDTPVRFSDDRAANYGLDPAKRPMSGYPARKGSWRRIGDRDFRKEKARWQSNACHRSLYSYQLRAALQLALEDPKRAVTFVGFACSGSEITTGLFLRYKGNGWAKYPPQLPQLSYISEELCGRGKSTPKDYTSGYTQLGKLPELQNMVLNKCYRPRRKIDLLMVSIGGNDVGFSSLVANAIFRDKTLLKNIGGWFGSVYGAPEARKRLKTLKIRYKALNKAFHYMLRIPWNQSDRILLTAYPRMALQADGQSFCPSGNAGMSLYADFSVMQNKLKEAAAFAEELYGVMKETARKYGWTFVDEHRDQFRPHGFCAIDPDNADKISEKLTLPRFKDGKWQGFKPSEYKPYASRQRWIRTPNDAYMTGHFHASDIVSRRLMHYKRSKWFQVVMAGTYSGSFHPTAEGHAAIADAVVKKAREVLRKYDRPS